MKRTTKSWLRSLGAASAATVIAASLPACKQSSGDAATSTGCPSGATKVPEGGFCLSVPAAYQPTPPYDTEPNRRDYNFTNVTSVVDVIVDTGASATDDWFNLVSQSMSSDSKKSGAQMRAQGDLPGGGKFVSWSEEGGKMVWARSLLHKSGKILECTARTPDSSQAQIIVDACKGLRFSD